jgi:hypothetical protein
MHALEDVTAVLELRERGLHATEIARRTGIPRGTVRDWLAGRLPRRSGVGTGTASCSGCGGVEHDFAALPASYVYLLGLYLGDGCISPHRRRVYKLRIVLDLAYPGIVASCERAIREVNPGRRVLRIGRRSNYVERPEFSNVEVYSYSKAWPCLFPQHGPGRKHRRTIDLVDWQKELLRRDSRQMLRGLIHSDGCRFINTGRKWRHPRYSFSNLSSGIRKIFCDACELLDVHYTLAGHTIYVSRKADVATLDRFIGPKS